MNLNTTPQNRLLPQFLAVVMLFCSVTTSAKPTKIEYSRELDTMVRALESIHPNPWRKILTQAFRDQLTRDPNILTSYPFGPWLSISRALKSLDRQQQDSVTGINLLQQESVWRLLPFTFARFDDGYYIVAADDPFASMIGKEIVSINGKTTASLHNRLSNYFPERDMDWLPQYMRITELLSFLGARCATVCEVKLSGTNGVETIQLTRNELIQSAEYQKKLEPAYLNRYFQSTNDSSDLVRMIDDNSLYWDISGAMLKSTILYNEQVALTERLLNNEMLDNIIIDLRMIPSIDPLLIERFSRLMRTIPEDNPHRKIYAMIDRSSRPVVFELLGRLAEIPEVQFVGQWVALELSHFYDPKTVQLANTGLEITVATRFKKYLTTYPDQQKIRPVQVEWNSADFFAQQDTLFNAIRDLIEINRR